jgi:hypothetical protein
MGVKITVSDCVPAGGTVVGAVKVKEPETADPVMGETADPPLNVEEASVCP